MAPHLLAQEVSEGSSSGVKWGVGEGRGPGQECVMAQCTKDKSDSLVPDKGHAKAQDGEGVRGAPTLHLSLYSFRTSSKCSSWAKSSVLCGSS